jgi:hypothetical protein
MHTGRYGIRPLVPGSLVSNYRVGGRAPQELLALFQRARMWTYEKKYIPRAIPSKVL